MRRNEGIKSVTVKGGDQTPKGKKQERPGKWGLQETVDHITEGTRKHEAASSN